MSDEDGTAVADGPLMPLVASVKGLPTKWKPVQIHENTISMTAGFMTKGPLTASSVDHQMGSTTRTFVEFDKNARWFLNAVE